MKGGVVEMQFLTLLLLILFHITKIKKDLRVSQNTDNKCGACE